MKLALTRLRIRRLCSTFMLIWYQIKPLTRQRPLKQIYYLVSLDLICSF